MAKYRIFSLESFEFVIEREITYDRRWREDANPYLVTLKEDFIYLNAYPGDAVHVGPATIKVFLTFKKAQKWVMDRCEKFEDFGVKPDQFQIESINTTL